MKNKTLVYDEKIIRKHGNWFFKEPSLRSSQYRNIDLMTFTLCLGALFGRLHSNIWIERGIQTSSAGWERQPKKIIKKILRKMVTDFSKHIVFESLHTET